MGGGVLENSLKVVKDGGTIVSLPTHQFPENLQIMADQRNVLLEFVLVQSSGEEMNTLKDMLEADELKPHVSKIFPFEKMTDAHNQIKSGQTVGKIVVTL